MTVLYSLTFLCSDCGAEVSTSVVPMFESGMSAVTIDPRPLNAHALEEHGQEPVVDVAPPEGPPPEVGYDSLVPGAIYVPPVGEPDPTVGDPLPSPDGDPIPDPEEAPAE